MCAGRFRFAAGAKVSKIAAVSENSPYSTPEPNRNHSNSAERGRTLLLWHRLRVNYCLCPLARTRDQADHMLMYPPWQSIGSGKDICPTSEILARPVNNTTCAPVQIAHVRAFGWAASLSLASCLLSLSWSLCLFFSYATRTPAIVRHAKLSKLHTETSRTCR